MRIKSQYIPNPNKYQIVLGYKKDKKTEFNLKERTFTFAKRILEIAAMLPRKTECDILKKQLVRAGTSIGANIEEADGTSTKPDFVNKLVIARKEAKEASYWLRLISGRYINSSLVKKDISECGELILIFSSIINKSR